MAQYPWMVRVTMITWSTLLLQMISMLTNCCFSFLPSPPQQFHGGLDEDGDGVGPLDDDSHIGHLVIPASPVEGLVIVSSGGEDGD